MSERMVELQRARLGLPPPPMGTSTSTSTASASALPSQPQRQSSTAARAPLQHQTSQQLAASTLYSEEEKLQKFLQRLQKQRDGGPTVPTSLARRMLQRQGVGYLDETVAMLTSAAADRFLATVLQQAVACRDRRGSGQELSKEEASRRRKHVSLYQQDSDYRKRRKLDRVSQNLQANLAAVEAARELSQKAAGADNKSNAAKKKNARKTDAVEDSNGKKNTETIGEDEVLDDDSLDDEERYYADYYGEYPEEDDDEDAEEDFMLLLRDLERPLEAWHFKLTGKVGLGAIPIEAVEPTTATIAATSGAAMEDADNDEGVDEIEEQENGDNGDTRAMSPKPSPGKGGKSAESAPDSAATSRAATPMTAPSPLPK